MSRRGKLAETINNAARALQTDRGYQADLDPQLALNLAGDKRHSGRLMREWR